MQTARGGEDPLKLWVLNIEIASVPTDSLSLREWIPSGLFKFQSMSQCTSANRERDRTWDTDRLPANSHNQCVHSFLRSLASISAEPSTGSVTEPSRPSSQWADPLQPDRPASQSPAGNSKEP